jgi:hypothetical protein
MAAVDYRVGIPLTFAWGNWSGKLAYEHTSAHLGDEFIVRTGMNPRDAVKEEIVLAIGHRPRDDVRIYGQYGHALHLATFVEDAKKERFNTGIEWATQEPTGVRGSPFAAMDLEFRGDCDYTPNITLQAGWLWRGDVKRPSLRVGAEYYDGRSPFFQFIDRHESWIAFIATCDY